MGDAEQDVLTRLAELRKAAAGEIADAAGDVKATRAALTRIFNVFELRPVAADLKAWMEAGSVTEGLPVRYPGFEDDYELPPEFELMPVVRDDAAVFRRVMMEMPHETAGKPRGRVDMRL